MRVEVGVVRGITVAALLLVAAGRPVCADAPPALKLYVVDSGVYRVSFEALAAAGWERVPDASRIGLRWRGEPVPIRLHAGPDGSFGPGDWLEFVGSYLPGKVSHFNQQSSLNVYMLSARDPAPRRSLAGAPAQACPSPAGLRRRVHLEQDRLRVRFSQASDETQEVWFWSKLTQIDAQPTRVELQLPELESAVAAPPALRLHLRGWSRLPTDVGRTADDHEVRVRLNGTAVGSGSWDNREDGFVLTLDEIPGALWKAGSNELEISVPPRVLGEESQPRVDVVLLNWVEVDYPRSAALGAEQVDLRLDDRAPAACIELVGAAAGAGEAEVWAGDGAWHVAAAPDATGRRHRAALPQSATSLWVVPAAARREPVAVVADRPSDLRRSARQADYIIVAHPTLLDAVRPLARFHEEHGLHVVLADVTDVYDEFSFGLTDPQAIRDFLAWAWANWSPPAPRFVLLVGDASWDARGATAEDRNYVDWTYQVAHRTEFGKNTSTPYAERSGLNYRDLIPTWSYATREGHAASDNAFVDVEGDDDRPEMAIGRLPVVEPAEVTAIVNKTLRYMASPEPGDWRRRVLWITNDEPGFQARSDRLAEHMEQSGYESVKVYPSAAEASNEAHTRELREAFDQGELIVHFFGHGGRYIWRTGPPDLTKNHDLFTLDDLDRLRPSGRLPVVLSMTCYSAPFDHPNADSIGEKFLRVADRGAVAVIAASWRNSPTQEVSRLLLDGLLTAPTVGEAFVSAKRQSSNRDFLNMYNLLGDPALRLARPDAPGLVAGAAHGDGDAH